MAIQFNYRFIICFDNALVILCLDDASIDLGLKLTTSLATIKKKPSRVTIPVYVWHTLYSQTLFQLYWLACVFATARMYFYIQFLPKEKKELPLSVSSFAEISLLLYIFGHVVTTNRMKLYHNSKPILQKKKQFAFFSFL